MRTAALIPILRLPAHLIFPEDRATATGPAAPQACVALWPARASATAWLCRAAADLVAMRPWAASGAAVSPLPQRPRPIPKRCASVVQRPVLPRHPLQLLFKA